MPLVFVTAFIDLHEDRSKDKSIDTCFAHFNKLVNTGISIHAFVSASYMDRMPAAPNLTVCTIELEDLDTYKAVQGLTYTVSPTNAPHHDTANFMVLMNAKVEFLHRVQALSDQSHYAWIDFSIFHVIKDEEAAAAYLQRLAASELPPKYVALPGCWSKGTAVSSIFRDTHWRFCGGFFVCDRDTLESFHSLYTDHFANIVTESKALVWEVNIWHYFEMTYGFEFGWYKADHNDSIIRAPIPFRAVASLTTIPPRFANCRKTLDSLLQQVDRIYLSIPEEYSRFPGAVELPEYLAEEPYASKVSVVRSPDFGPATKYLGAIKDIPENRWIFFCDDDQEYSPDLLARMSEGITGPGAYQNHYRSIEKKTSGGQIHGYVGVLIHSSCLSTLDAFPLPTAARFVDDQWMSIYCFKNDVPVHPTKAEEYGDIFRVLQNGHELYGAESLAGLNNRGHMVKEIEGIFGVRFEGPSIHSA